MSDLITTLGSLRVLSCDENGPQISTEADINRIIGTAFGERVDLVALPDTRLTEDFFDLKTGFAGLLVQKFVNYQLRLAILGDISGACARSKALNDFVYESNRGSVCWFLKDREELDHKLNQRISK
ncbi:DUF4180 domain-containing protein [Providencia rettgeri]|uniref:DUF4180 domain-containing protein n=1 Tax=Providencia rettgeri TaxID=587 RepID=UPI0034E0D648